MGKGQSGVKSWMDTCPVCGKRYRYTNFMRRYTLNGKVADFQYRYFHNGTNYNYKQTDTHILACERKKQIR
ncbi:hypothetical protein LCGC14_0767720 [marine sediment metagenome]|uniref:Uncharacterized protein n=1 Tax=marine sediment metagenome TaxID=412755 RepID=A0A0F9QJ11_9ZZZZ